MSRKIILVAMGMATGLILAKSVQAEITYERKINAITINGYPQGSPCHLADIKEANDKGDWRKVSYNEKSDTYFIEANLNIGIMNKNSYSCLQMGYATHPRETLILAGNLTIIRSDKPYKEGAENNCLIMGSPVNQTYKPSLKMNSPDGTGGGICVQSESRLCLYNSRITRAEGSGYYDLLIQQGGAEIRKADISGVKSFVFRHPRPSFVSETLIHDSSGYLMGLDSCAEAVSFLNVTFSKPGTGLSCFYSQNSGAITPILKNCRFLECECNVWGSLGGSDITLLNCEDTGSYNLVNGGAAITNKRYLIVKVVDQNNQPIAEAEVNVVNEDADGPEPENFVVSTDSNGLTPFVSSGDAPLVVDSVQRPKESNEKYDREITAAYTYKIIVAKDRYKTKIIAGLNPDASWFRSVWPEEDKRPTLVVKMMLE